MNRFPRAWRQALQPSEPPRSEDAEINTALYEAWLWMNCIHGHVSTLYEDPEASARAISKCAGEVRDWIELLAKRARKYYRRGLHDVPHSARRPGSIARRNGREHPAHDE
jgi:hypothetical protein